MIALIGGEGSIGRRYQAILNHLGKPYRVIEAMEPDELNGCEKAIIACPTDVHEAWIWECHYRKVPFLCEKPLVKNKESIQTMMQREVNGYVVNNWAFISTNFSNRAPDYLSYDFFSTGKDGIIWDVCQLILISDIAQCPLSVRTDSYWWDAQWGDFKIPYSFIEQSYLQMLRAFLNNDFQRLWGLNKAYRMTELCETIEKLLKETGGPCEGFDWHSSEKRLTTFPRENLREDRSEGTDQMEL